MPVSNWWRPLIFVPLPVAADGTLPPLLLDNSAGAAAAYSLRKLKRDYAGAAIRVRRSSDNAEQDIGFVDDLLDTVSLLAFVGSGNGFVRTWYDQTGNAKHAVQTTAGSQPRIVTGGVVEMDYGRPTISFYNGWSLNAGDITASTNCDVFVVYDTNTGRSLIASGGGSSTPWFGMAESGISSLIHSNYGSIFASVNGKLVSPATRAGLYTALTATRRLVRFESADFSTQTEFAINGYSSFDNITSMQELIVFGQDKSAEIAAIELDINNFYDIYGDEWLRAEGGAWLRCDGGAWLRAGQWEAPLLLDLYPGAAAAYSLRKLRAGYNGAAIRVRRSSDATELDIGFRNGVLDSIALLGFVGAGNGFVTTWYDQSGNARNATQTTATSQPRIVNAGVVESLNGKPAVFTDGTNDSFIASINGFNSANNVSAFILSAPVAAAAADTATATWVWSGPADTTKVWSLASQSGIVVGEKIVFLLTTLSNGRLGSTTYSRVANQQQLLSLLTLSSGTSLFSNGSQVTLDLAASMTTSTDSSPSAMNYTADHNVYFSTQANGTGYSSIRFQEILIYTSNQSAKRAAIEANINTYYAIY